MKKSVIEQESKNLAKQFAEFNIRKERSGEESWKKQDLAIEIDVTPGYISNIMSGERQIPLDRALQLSQVFGCTIDQISTRLALELEAVAEAIPVSQYTVVQDVMVVGSREVKDFIKVVKRGGKLPISEEIEMIHWPHTHSKNTYAIPVHGQAMAPQLPAGSQAIVDCDKKDDPEVGKTILWTDKGKLVFAKYNGDRHVEFVNESYPDRVFRLPERAAILGQVVGKQIFE